MPRIQPIDPSTATGDTAIQLAIAGKMFGATPKLVTTAANSPAAARLAGITDAEVIEIVGHVALNVFANYLNNVSDTEINFPVVALDAAA